MEGGGIGQVFGVSSDNGHSPTTITLEVHPQTLLYLHDFLIVIFFNKRKSYFPNYL